ncbi:glucan 1,4-alpha-glucosidase [Cellvibrio mixtus]|uniref:glucan 1,4-alpha-glucosidase n=1 Tax=Cellvibrio mixtus TaxID=39650 RepID=UPI000587EEA6|nr:glucan 1,4-alpha-glucosidase [Cellvibrio mixtus]
MKKNLLALTLGSAVLSGACLLVACSDKSTSPQQPATAPGAPGKRSLWSYSGKTGIGTSFEQYSNGTYSDAGATGTVSKVWFSIAQGILTETMYGLIHEAQLQELQFFIKGNDSLGEKWLDEEKKDTVSTIEYLNTDPQGRPTSLAYKIVNKDKEGKYEIEKHIFTDPDSQALMMRVKFRALEDGITPYIFVNPSIANTGSNDSATYANNTWTASEGNVSMSLKTNAPVAQSTVGFEGVSDGITEIKQTGSLTKTYASTGNDKGNVAFTLQLNSLKKDENAQWDLVLGFGKSPAESQAAAEQTLAKGYDKVLAHYNGDGDAIGWQDFLASLPALEKLSATATDGGKLLYTSAMVLKAQEDKTHAGAFIASLSNPWGDIKPAEKSATGYKAVWPRDFYQVAMAMLALGDTESPRVAFEYLEKVQAGPNVKGYTGTPGWFLQKTHVDGEVEWVGVQLDQTAMPIMLGWRLWKEGVLSDADIGNWYNKMLKPAANFLVDGGPVKILWNDTTIKPPYTQQERWEEQPGYSPSTTAAVIAGLVSAADIATQAGDAENAKRYLAAADSYSKNLDALLFTTKGSLTGELGNGKYFLRMNTQQNPNEIAPLEERNGQVIPDQSQVIDGGFLELVRYGVRAATDNNIQETLPEYDNQKLPDLLRVKYEFTFPGVDGTFPGWRRYGIDGYGEDTVTGAGYAAVNDTSTKEQRGRVWPFFTGERGHYELQLAKANKNLDTEKLRNTYVKAMELFANEGMMLPEQVWDGVGNNSVYNFTLGEGTNSATPLAWTHAEYVKLLRSLSDEKVWDRNASTEARYVK